MQSKAHTTYFDPATGGEKTTIVTVLDKETRNGQVTAFLVEGSDGARHWASPENVTHQWMEA